MREEAAQRRGRLWRIVTSAAFEVTVALVIISNGVVMGVEAQYAGYVLAEDLGHEDAATWPHALEVFDVIHWVFGMFFFVEIALRIGAIRTEFVRDVWNWIDLTIVILWLYSVVTKFGVNAQFIRLARLARVVRLVRLIKFMQANFNEGLFLMATALADSMMTTAWTFVLFFVVHAMLALFINQVLNEFYFESESSGSEEQLLVYEYFGSFTRAFLTMFEITFDNWSNGVRALVNNVSEVFIIYAVLHKTILGFAAIGVLGAVFVQETFQVAEMDDNLIVRQQARKESMHAAKMQRLFDEADVDGDGSIDMDEWLEVARDQWMQIWLRAQDLKAPQDAQRVFEMLDDGDGRLSSEELIVGTASIKGSSAIVKILGLVQGMNDCVNAIRAELLFAPLAVAAERE